MYNAKKKKERCVLESKEERLIELLESRFNRLPITRLGELSSKISLISKVRYGEYADCKEYDEVNLSTLDVYGVLQVYKSAEELGAANAQAIESQKLYPNDILISYRGSRNYKVGRVGDHYKRAVVGNNSAIRIQLKGDLSTEIVAMIQEYLKQDYVQSYLAECSYAVKLKSLQEEGKENKPKHSKRQFLSSDILYNLPIPKFIPSSDFSFIQEHNRHLLLESLSLNIQNSSTDIHSAMRVNASTDLQTYCKDSKLLSQSRESDEKMIERLKEIDKELSDIVRVLG